LIGAQLLLPRNGNQLRSGIDRRLDKHRLYPRMIVEFDDSALIKALEQQCTGIFIPRVAIEAEVEQQYQVTAIGRVDEVIGHTR
jgi:LysR family transcriptional activator of nhaA